MRKQWLALGLIAGLATVIMVGCGGSGGGGSTSLPISPATGSVAVFGGDAPLCSILSFTGTIAGGTLTRQAGGSPVSVLPSGKSVTLDFASLMDFAAA